MLETKDILALLQLPGVGRRTAWMIVRAAWSRGASEGSLFNHLAELRHDVPRFHLPSQYVWDRSLADAHQIINEANRTGISVIGFGDPKYPAPLARIPDPPPVLYVKGNDAALNRRPAVAIIGTREPTRWGEAIAVRFGRRFAEYGCTVVSGLALGCDVAAQWGCVRASGVTVAVLAHGLHTVYPAAHRAFADEVVSTGGCLLSEYPPGVRANRSFFIERDRLQSGLSDGVVVVETDVIGGTMHTVEACLQQERVLACLAHPQKYLSEPKSRGNQALIASGKAMPLADAKDVEAFLDKIRSQGVTGERPFSGPVSPGADSSLFAGVEEHANGFGSDSRSGSDDRGLDVRGEPA
jgi:DNA processing protein